MITTSEFKKHFGKPFGNQLRNLGFKGSGFHYKKDSDNFVFTIGIQASRYGNQCCAEFGIQPKSLKKNSLGIIDFKKLKYFDCEFRTRISQIDNSDKWWKYSDTETKNIQIANEVYELIKSRILPIINEFESHPKILERIEPSDLDNLYTNFKNIIGMTPMSTEIRMAWVLAKSLENTNPKKAVEFANYGLSKLNGSSKFFGKQDFEKIMGQKNSA